jgi:uncharacterized membrane protein
MTMTPSGVSLPEPQADERQMAMFAHLGGCIVWLLAPGLIYVLKGKDSKFIAYHSIQAMIYHVIALILYSVFSSVTCGFGAIALPLFWIPAIYWGVMKANKGEWAGYPGIAGIGMPTE